MLCVVPFIHVPYFIYTCDICVHINYVHPNNFGHNFYSDYGVWFLVYMSCMCVLFQSLLFNPPPNSKTFSRGQNIVGQDLDLYIDCFVSCFRITPHNNDVLKVCLNTHSPPIYHFVLVNALHRIITQVRLKVV